MTHHLANSGIVAAVIAGVGVGVLGFPIRRFLVRRGIIDKPNQRSSHSELIPRGGGLAIIMTVMAFGIWLMVRSSVLPVLALMLGMLGLAAVSFGDDIRPIPLLLRIGCHFAASLAGIWALGLTSTRLGFGLGGGLLAVTLIQCSGVLWIAGYINSFNFMDGINGIAAGQAALTGFGSALIGGLVLSDFASPPVYLSMVIAGAAAGFLPHNFPKARMFMGDVGSVPLGFLLAVEVLWIAKVAGWWLLIPLALLQANFVLDAAVTLFRRAIAGEYLPMAHQEHFYQRLLRSGKSHTFVTSLEMGLQVLIIGSMVSYLFVSKTFKILLIGMVIAVWSAFFYYCEMAFRKSANFRCSIHDNVDLVTGSN